MPKFLPALPVYFMLLLMFSCVGQKKTDPMQYNGKSISLGSGGGFAGIEKQYRLLNNGQLYYRTSRDTSFIMIEAKSKKSTKNWFVRFESLELDKTDFNHPGNIYRFIEANDGKQKKRIVWGSGNPEPDRKITGFYEGFMNYWIPLKHEESTKN